MTKKAVTKKQKKVSKLDPNIAQRAASDPKASVWLNANAGTGKTKVLTDRVLRLLLEGSAPEDILCVTYTTAAAALMQRRIRAKLSEWTTGTDYMLDKALKDLTGKKPDVALRYHARQLFARFLEAPEGIKIQTIHSFSQTLIKKFPIESGVPPSFKVMDSEDSLGLIKEAQAEVLNVVQSQPNSNLAQAVKMITPEVGEAEFISLIQDIVSNREQFANMVEKHGSIEKTIDAVYTYLGTKRGVSGGDLRFAVGVEEGDNSENKPANIGALQEAVGILSTGSKVDQEKASLLSIWLEARPDERNLMFKEYKSIFLTDKGELRKRLATKGAAAALPALETEARRLIEIIEAIRTSNVASGTEALLILGEAVLKEYEASKVELNYLDYDDLILKASKLLDDNDNASWVLRKLPGHLKHILVDEAQDTSPHQWQIVESLMTAFLNDPEKKKKSDRTLFIVGDEKQSIFSFQGADPEEYRRRKKLFETLVSKSGGEWRDVDMDITFRSSPAILEAVDAVFTHELAARGVKFDSDTPIKHNSYRAGHAGLVEVTSIVQGHKADDIEPWSLPDTLHGVDDATITLAENVADRIKGWLDSGEILESRGRPINPNDIIILMRRRSSFIDHVVRALKKRDIPVSGVDRMVLSEQISVKDLVALGEVLLDPTDDYKLAVILKSPLFGLTEKQLEALAIGRKGSLWDALEKKSQGKSKRFVTYKKAFDYLVDLKEQMNTYGVYKLYSNILLQPCPTNTRSGLAAIYKRLGSEAEDPMVEFLNALERFEQDNPPSLQSFLSWVTAGGAEVKREMSVDSQNPKVSIMTVHGAKGLEAPIVILPDTTGVPADNVRARPRLLWPKGDRAVPLWVPHTDLENKVFREEKSKIEQLRDNEFLRLMYVAMTRAADRLYVYGQQNRTSLRELSWYNIIQDGLKAQLGDKVEIVENSDGSARMTYKTLQTAKPMNDNVKPLNQSRRTALPSWARTAPKAEITLKDKFTPSKAGQDLSAKKNKNKVFSLPSPLEATSDDGYRFKYGNATHNLLEYITILPKEDREKAARSYLTSSDLGLTQAQQGTIWTEVDAILSHPDYAFMFGDKAKAEVSIVGDILVKGKTYSLNGQIDRLVVEDDTVWIIDYKSNKKIPEKDKDTPELYLTQMASYKEIIQSIYPDKKVKTALLWTRAPKMQVLADKDLQKIARKFGIGKMAVVPRSRSTARKTAPTKAIPSKAKPPKAASAKPSASKGPKMAKYVFSSKSELARLQFVRLIKSLDVRAVKNFPMSFRVNEITQGYLGLAYLALGKTPQHIEITKYVLSLGADPNATNDVGRTPVHEAAFKGYVECLDLLLAAGGCEARKDALGMNARALVDCMDKPPFLQAKLHAVIDKHVKLRDVMRVVTKPVLKRRKR